MLKDFINSNKKPHAVIFNITVCAPINKTINEYIKSIVCEGLSDDEKILYATKVDKSSYADLIEINGFLTTIKKEDILNIQNSFSYPGVEKINKKIYVIYGIENITKQAANSLLKFLEEPPKNTFAIFVTKSLNTVLDTIKSRCQTFYINPSKEGLNKLLDTYKITDFNQIRVASNYPSLDELENDLKNDSFFEIYNEVNDIFLSIKDVKKQKETLDVFKKQSYMEIEKIIDIIKLIAVEKQEQMCNLKNLLKFNPNKVLLFNKICSIIQ